MAAQSTPRRPDRDSCLVCDALVEALVVLDQRGAIVHANQAARALLDRRELLGRADDKSLETLCGEVDLASLACGPAGQIQVRLNERWLTASRHELPEASPVTCSVLVIRDESALREALTELEWERRLFLDGPVIVFRWVATEGWPVEYVSPNVDQLFGRSADDFMTGRVPYASTVHPDDLDRVADEVSAHSAAGAPTFEQEYRIVRPDGEVRWLFDFTVVNRDARGEVGHFSGYAFDVTERKLQQQAQERLEEQVRQTQNLESLGVLAGGIAHDFNNLLVGIMGNASLAREDLPADSPTQVLLAEIERASLRAAELSNRMLAYSGKGCFSTETIDLNELLQETVMLVQSSLSANAQLHFDLSDELPLIEGDATQLRQLVMNLVTNASDALIDGQGTIAISSRLMELGPTHPPSDDAFVAGLSSGPYLILKVSDDGKGMDEETQRKLFEPFYSTKFTGRGLGMATALGIVRSHKGAIRVSSELGLGSRFEVMLPVAAETLPAPVREPTEVTAPDHRGHVLIVDDEELVLQLAQQVLERAGFSVSAFTTGQDAIAHLQATDPLPELVLLDLTMPQFDGSQTLAELKRLAPQVPVILSSGFSEQEATKIIGEGLSGFIQKPYSPSSLVAAVGRALTQLRAGEGGC